MSCLSSTSSNTPCQVGALDFAGGGPVHIASGFAALALCYVIGRRKTRHSEEKPHNLVLVFIGTGLLWFLYILTLKVWMVWF